MVVVRPMRPEDGQVFIDVHHAAVRGLAAGHYPPDVIADWAPLPLTEQHLAGLARNPDNELRLVAEIDGEIVGIGVLVVARSELRACHVAPQAVRKGVGRALVQEIERLAQDNGLTTLQLAASLNAEAFYRSLGYAALGPTEHVLRSGTPMACVKTAKTL